MSSPTQRTLALYRKEGWTCDVVERYVPRYLGTATVDAIKQKLDALLRKPLPGWVRSHIQWIRAKLAGKVQLSLAGHRKDAFGFGDVIAFMGDETALLQACAYSGISARKKKILGIPEAREWLQGANRRIIVVGWRKPKHRWEPRIVEITLEDFDG